MNKIEKMVAFAIMGLMIASVLPSMSLIINTVHAAPLPPQLAAADLNNDGNVTLADLVGFANIYGWDSTNPGWNSPMFGNSTWRNPNAADFNNNSRIDLGDLVTLAYCYSLNSSKS